MRIKGGVVTKKRHKKILKQAKGYRDKRSNVWSLARRAVFMAGKNAYVSRKVRKRDFRRMWITRLNTALEARGVAYNRFIFAASRKRVLLNRKMLSELAIREPQVFDEVVKFVTNASEASA